VKVWLNVIGPEERETCTQAPVGHLTFGMTDRPLSAVAAVGISLPRRQEGGWCLELVNRWPKSAMVFSPLNANGRSSSRVTSIGLMMLET